MMDHLARLQLAARTTYYLACLTAILAALMHVAKIATLLNNGVLFLDDLPEFPRNVLEVTRQPLEDGCQCNNP